MIEDNYKEGDIVLVEGLASNKAYNSQEHGKIFSSERNYMIRGWEPENQEYDDDFLNLHDQKWDEVKEAFLNTFRSVQDFSDIKSPSDVELKVLKEKLKGFVKTVQKLNEYFKSNADTVLQANKKFAIAFEKYKKAPLASKKQELENIISLIKKILGKFGQEEGKAKYSQGTIKDIETVRIELDKRNASLIAQIDKYRKEGRRVFVITGKRQVHSVAKKSKSICIQTNSL